MQVVLIVVLVIIAAAIADGLYSIYERFSANRETKIENKESGAVAQDQTQETKDDAQADTDVDNYHDAVNKFKGDAG
jgi:hypothetical protein